MTPSPAAARVSAESECGRALDLELGALDELVDEARHRRREGEPAPLPVGGEQAQEEQELLLDRHLAGLVVDEEDPLGGRVEHGAEVGADGRDEALRLPERLGERRPSRRRAAAR